MTTFLAGCLSLFSDIVNLLLYEPFFRLLLAALLLASIFGIGMLLISGLGGGKK